MADLSQTAANVAMGGSTTKITRVIAGEAITQGNAVYLKTSDSKYYKTDADVLATSLAAGIALTPASTDGYFVMATEGLVNLGATLTVGLEYYCSTNAGAICPIGDLTTGDFPTRLGFATSASLIDLKIFSAGVAKA